MCYVSTQIAEHANKPDDFCVLTAIDYLFEMGAVSIPGLDIDLEAVLDRLVESEPIAVADVLNKFILGDPSALPTLKVLAEKAARVAFDNLANA